MKVDRRKKKSLQKFDFEKWDIVWKYKIDFKSGTCIENPLGPNTSQSLQEVLNCSPSYLPCLLLKATGTKKYKINFTQIQC